MKLDAERLEHIQVVLTGQGETQILFYQVGDKVGKKEFYSVSHDSTGRFDPRKNEDEDTYYTRIDYIEDFLKRIGPKELTASIFIGYTAGKEQNEFFDSWEQLSRYLGIGELVAISAKVPKIIARRFDAFSSRLSTRSGVLRQLIYDYVKEQYKERLDELIFREEV